MTASVVIFKATPDSENEKDPYSDVIESAGFKVYMIPVLEFEFIGLDELLLKLKTPSEYSGLIFTSPRTVNGVKLAVRNEVELLKKWEKHSNYAVGERTAKLVEGIGMFPIGQDAGNANALAGIITESKFEKPFLYPTGSLTQPTLKQNLRDKGVSVDEITIYKTKAHSSLQSNIKTLLGSIQNKETIFVYFSPSGVNFTLPILKELQYNLNNIKFVAIGGTTEASLQNNGLKVSKVAAKPNSEALLDAIKSLQDCS